MDAEKDEKDCVCLMWGKEYITFCTSFVGTVTNIDSMSFFNVVWLLKQVVLRKINCKVSNMHFLNKLIDYKKNIYNKSVSVYILK